MPTIDTSVASACSGGGWSYEPRTGFQLESFGSLTFPSAGLLASARPAPCFECYSGLHAVGQRP